MILWNSSSDCFACIFFSYPEAVESVNKESDDESIAFAFRCRRINRMLELEGISVRDFASNDEIKFESVGLLWQTLRKEDTEIKLDYA